LRTRVPAGQLDLKLAAVTRCPKQDRLLLQQRAGLTVLKHALDDEPCLIGVVAHADELWLGAGSAIRPEVLGETLGCQTDHAVGGAQDGLRRAVVAIERDDIGRRTELIGKVENVPYLTAATAKSL
jgi:hypothetical protein